MSDKLDFHLLIDEEASPEQLQLIRDSLSQDAVAQQEYQFYSAMKQKLGGLEPASAFNQTESAKLFSQAMKKVGRKSESFKAEKFVSKYAFALTGALFLFVISSGLVMRQSPASNKLSSADVSGYMSSNSAGTMGSVGWDQLGGWINSKLGRTPVNVQPQAWKVQRAIEINSKTGKLVRIDFADEKGPFTLMIVSNTNGIDGMKECPDTQFKESMINGVPCVCWTADGYAFIVMGDRKSEELQAIGSVLRR